MTQAFRIVASAAFLAFLLCCPHPAAAQSATPVSTLDANRFTGSWNEIARFPVRREKQCIGREIVLCAVGDKANSLQLVTSCQVKSDQFNARNDKGKFDKRGTGALTLSRLLILHSRYWVLAIDPGYNWVLVGTPNHKSLWILSRLPTIPPDQLAEIKSKARAQGFDISKLIAIPQPNESKAGD
jgi:apolipoprotein D and lipocalin family protein